MQHRTENSDIAYVLSVVDELAAHGDGLGVAAIIAQASNYAHYDDGCRAAAHSLVAHLLETVRRPSFLAAVVTEAAEQRGVHLELLEGERAEAKGGL